MPNMSDVAKYAGVSKSTVSKVLNNYPNLSEQTTRRVMEAVSELQYVPNQTASSLSKKDFKKVGIIFKVNDTEQTIDEVNMQYMIGIDEACSELNVDYSVIFARTLEGKNQNEIVNYLRSKSITNLVVIGLAKDDETIYQIITDEIFPTVITEVELVTDKISCVGSDNYRAQYQIAEKFIKKYNAHRVLYISGKENGYVSEQRLRAIKDLSAIRDFELVIKDGKFKEREAYQIICDSEVNYDIVICASDLMAIGANRALQERGYHLPITGFDGISLLNYVGRNIRSVKQDFYKIGYQSVIQAINMQKGEKGKKVDIDYELI